MKIFNTKTFCVSLIFVITIIPAHAGIFSWFNPFKYRMGQKVRAAFCRVFLPKKVERWNEERNVILREVVAFYNFSTIRKYQNSNSAEYYRATNNPKERNMDDLKKCMLLSCLFDPYVSKNNFEKMQEYAAVLEGYEKWLDDPRTIINPKAQYGMDILPTMTKEAATIIGPIVIDETVSLAALNEGTAKKHQEWREKAYGFNFLSSWLKDNDRLKKEENLAGYEPTKAFKKRERDKHAQIFIDELRKWSESPAAAKLMAQAKADQKERELESWGTLSDPVDYDDYVIRHNLKYPNDPIAVRVLESKNIN